MTKRLFPLRAPLALSCAALFFLPIAGASTRAVAAWPTAKTELHLAAKKPAAKTITTKPVARAAFGTLGGKTETPRNASTRVTVAPRVTAPRIETRVSGQTQPANSKSGESANNASGSTALGALPYDLSQVKRLRVAGKLVDETPIRVGNMDVLAPIVGDNSSILSTVGATASRAAAGNLPPGVSVSDNQTFQINRPEGVPIVMRVGKASAWLGGEELPLRAAPLVIGGKIWLPVFSVAPLLGASARLNVQTGTLYLNPTVQSVEVFPARGYTVLTVKTSAPIPDGAVLMGEMTTPPKLYFTFANYSMGFDAANTSGERIVSTGYGNVQQVRGGLYESFPDKTRVVLDLGKAMDVNVQQLPEKNLFAIILRPIGESGAMTQPPPLILDVPEPAPIGNNDTLRGATIVVDAGHGGHDSGARGSKSLEKTHALDISRRLRTELQKRGANVLMTRDGDYFISLQGRADFANSRRADIFCSVHINSFRSTSSGTETFYYTGQSRALAREVHQELTRATGLPNRGVTSARFYVIRKTEMPSILTETAFISNSREEALLMKPEFRQKVARGIAQGISNYFARGGRK